MMSMPSRIASIMLLVENGDVRLDDKVKRYLPDFTGGGKDTITVRHLLTHYSGLPADFDLSKEWFGYAAALQELWKIKTDTEPGKEFKYSDLNYIALGELVRSVSGKSLDAFAREHIFVPLDMTDTGFLPSATLQPRIAPTESRGNALRYLKGQASKASMDQILRGEVHDPTTWRMEGVAGHAGLFSSARDIAVFAQMLLDGGTLHGARILSPMTVQAMTRPQSPTNSVEVRGLVGISGPPILLRRATFSKGDSVTPDLPEHPCGYIRRPIPLLLFSAIDCIPTGARISITFGAPSPTLWRQPFSTSADLRSPFLVKSC
jgi:CubicO group peptidase (beta-lactamase class C family)